MADEPLELGALLDRYDQLREAGKDPIFTAASIGHWVAEHRHLLRSEAPKSELSEVARWMIAHGYATGHGDTLDDLLRHLVREVSEGHVKDSK